MITLSEQIVLLDAGGWAGQLEVAGGGIRCLECGVVSAPEACVVDRVERFEGPSDPGDESILFALTPRCGHRGTLVAPFGAATPAEFADAVRRLGPTQPR